MTEFADNISNDERDLILFLSEKLELAIRAIQEIPTKNSINLQQVAEHIKDLKEEIKTASQRDLPSLFYQLNLQHSLAKRMAETVTLPDCSAPFFAFMLLEDDKGKIKDYFLGHVSFLSAAYKTRILDWKKAPLAQVFYQNREDEEFFIELDQGDISGTLKQRCLLSVQKGRLVRVERGDCIFQLTKHNSWEKVEEIHIALEGGAGQAIRQLPFGVGYTNERSCELLGLLDQTQYDLIQRRSDKPLLIIGGAGSGKTTVALHRLAVLCEKYRHFPNQVLVIVPHQGLIRLSQKLLDSIGQSKIKIKTADEWFLSQCQKLFTNIKYKMSKETPAFVSLVKRHPKIQMVFDIYLENYKQDIIEKLEKIQLTLQPFELTSLGKIFSTLERMNLTELQQFRVKEMRALTSDVQYHLQSIFSNHPLMMKLADFSHGVVQPIAIEETLKRSLVQIRWQNEDGESHGHDTLDGRMISEGQRDSNLGFLDKEDCVLLLLLNKKIWGTIQNGHKQLKAYKHLVLDEAQELSTGELNILGEAIRAGGQVTIAGDSLQQIDASLSFQSWQQVLSDLGVDVVDPEELKISYRSPQHIIDLAHHVLGPLSDGNKPLAKKQGVPVKITPVEHLAHASLVLYEALETLFYNEKSASVAMICHSLDAAKMLFSQLKELQNVRLIEDSEFSFKPGIDITTVEQIRGLEFDYVIIPDIHCFAYPDTLNARKRLHLAVTRAIHQVWMLYAQERTPLVTKEFMK